MVATIAADALGPENLRCVMLPSEYTSEDSLADATAVAERLGCRYDTVPIGKSRAAVTETLAPLFEGTAPDVTEENIPVAAARIVAHGAEQQVRRDASDHWQQE